MKYLWKFWQETLREYITFEDQDIDRRIILKKEDVIQQVPG
jgi:hypothetical protein